MPLKARRKRIFAMLKRHTAAQARWLLAQLDALTIRTKRDNENLKRYLVNTAEIDEARIGALASLALAPASAEDVRRYHGGMGKHAIGTEWPLTAIRVADVADGEAREACHNPCAQGAPTREAGRQVVSH